jgi:GT2 family glycosyltransferase
VEAFRVRLNGDLFLVKDYSIIIPNLNTPSIDKAIKSLEDQRFDHERFEVIVVGMDKYGLVRESPLVHFDRSEYPLSPAQARNRGAKQAAAEVLIFMDADCIANPDLLNVYEGRLKSMEIIVVGGGVKFSTHNYWTLADNLSMFHDYLACMPAALKPQLPSLNLAVRKDIFLSLGGFDERYPYPAGEDSDLTIRLKQKGVQLYFEPKAVIYHNPHRNSLSDLWKHAYYQGMYSTKVDPRYMKDEGLPGIFRNSLVLILGSPLLAVATTFKIFATLPQVRPFWYTFPAILLAKFAWCMGAAHHRTTEIHHAT